MRLLLTIALSGLSFLAIAADSPPPIPGETVEDVLEHLKQDETAKIQNQGGWTIVESEENRKNVLWSFTPEGHPAHPAVIKRTLVERDGAIYIDMTARCGGPKPACDELWSQFEALNERMKQAIAGGG